MNKEEIKYCKFCDKEKPINEFCKSGFAIKNICKECRNKKQTQTYRDGKKVKELQQRIEKAIEFTTLRFNEDNHLSCGSVARLLSILKGEEK